MWRVSPAGARDWLATISPQNVTHQFFAQTFGGGRYWVEIRRTTKKGTSRQETREIRIDPSIPKRIPSWSEGGEGEGDAPAPARRNAGEQDPDMRDLFRQQVIEMIKDSNEMRAQSGAAQMAMLSAVTATIQSMTNSSAALVKSVVDGRGAAGPAAPGLSMTDMLNFAAQSRKELLEMINLRDSLAKGGGEAGGIDRALALIEKFRKISDDFPGGGDESPSGGIVGELAKAVLPYLAQRLLPGVVEPGPEPAPAAAVRAIAPAPPAAPARDYSFLPKYVADPEPTNGAQPTVAAAPAPPSTHEPVPPRIPLPLQFAIESLYEAAQRVDDPKAYAQNLFDLVPEKYKPKLYEAVMRPTAVEDMIAFAPVFAEHREWLTRCVAAMRKEFEGGADDEAEAPGE